MAEVKTFVFCFNAPSGYAHVGLRTYVNQTTGTAIDFYEISIKPFQAHPYPDLGLADLVGYNGISPGPTFRIQKGRESVVRFVNQYDRPSAIHLHGSPSRAPFDGWAEDVIQPGQFKVSQLR